MYHVDASSPGLWDQHLRLDNGTNVNYGSKPPRSTRGVVDIDSLSPVALPPNIPTNYSSNPWCCPAGIQEGGPVT